MRYFGGLITKTPPQLDPALGNAAEGVFTMDQYMQATRNNTWPSRDPYWKNTVMLLHGDGTNAAQNNTFLDSSTNNFDLTRNGNTTQGTFSPYWSGRYSYYQDSASDYLTTSLGADAQFGTGDFTVECWVYMVTNSGIVNPYIIDSRTQANWAFSFDWSGNQTATELTWTTQASGVIGNSATQRIPLNQWVHCAYVRLNGVGSLYINGQVVATAADTADYSVSVTTAFIGRRHSASVNQSFPGYFADFRMVKGQALASGTFNPPTSRLTTTAVGWSGPLAATALTGTVSLLMFNQNRVADSANSSRTFSVFGPPSITTFSPVNPVAAAYDPAVNGGSGYFDGSGDYINGVNGQSALQFGTGDFTVECWIYATGAASYSGERGWLQISGATGGLSTSYTAGIFLAFRSAGNSIYYSVDGNNNTGGTTQLNAWNHVALTREGSTVRGWLNGVQVVTYSNSSNLTANNLVIGGYYNTSYLFEGYISGVRIVKGTALYSTTFTPPTAPPTPVAGTGLIANFANAGIFDTTGVNDLETVGNAQIDTSVKKYGTGSMEFDGNGDWLLMRDTPEMILGTGDFTIETWVNVNGNQGSFIIDFRPSGTNGAYVCLYVSGATFRLFVSSADRITSSSINYNQWYHLALTRSGTSTKMFLDGVQTGSTYTDSNNYLVGSMRPIIATSGSSPSGAGNAFNGYIDELRITKGIARYVSNFTPQRSAWQDT